MFSSMSFGNLIILFKIKYIDMSKELLFHFADFFLLFVYIYTILCTLYTYLWDLIQCLYVCIHHTFIK